MSLLARALVFFLVLVATNLHADTSFKAGDGDNLVFGHSVLTVNIPKTPGGESDNLQCLLLGTVRGKPVVIPIDKKPDPADARYNKLYMVEIIDSKTARHSDLEMNSIPVDMTGTDPSDPTPPISQLLWKTFDLYDPIYPPFGHPIGRILELPEQDKDGGSILLFTHGLGDLYQLNLTQTYNEELQLKTLKATKARRWESQFHYINLDLIDLNGYVRIKDGQSPTSPIPYSIAVWYQRLGVQTRNFWAQADRLALAEFSASDGLTIYQSLEDVAPFTYMRIDGPDFWHLNYYHGWYYQYMVVGGAFIHPDRTGTLRYWFSVDDFKYKGSGNPSSQDKMQEHFIRTWSAELSYDLKTGRIHIGEQLVNTNTRTWWQTELFTEYVSNDLMERLVRYWTGPALYLQDDKISVMIHNATDLDPLVKYTKTEWTDWPYVEGKLGSVSDAELNALNITGISEYDDIPDKDLTPWYRNEKSMRNAHVNVAAVVYGWPYFIEADSPSLYNTPAFSRTNSSETVRWTKGSYGGGFEAEAGWSFGGFSASAIGGFNWESGTEKTWVETSKLAASVDFENAKTFSDFSKFGVVVYNPVEPLVQKSYNFAITRDGKDISEFTLRGLDGYTFAFHVTSFAVSLADQLSTVKFDITDPRYEADESTREASALSYGLEPRVLNIPGAANITSIKANVKVVDPDTNKERDETSEEKKQRRDAWIAVIEQWEDQVGLKEFLSLNTRPTETGVTPVTKLSYRLSDQKRFEFSKTYSEASTSDQTWYGGAHFKVKPTAGAGFVGDLKVMHTGSYSTKDSQQTGNAYGIDLSGIQDAILGRAEFFIHCLDIDIAKLKSYLARHPELFDGKKPAMIPTWNWKYHQDFTLVVTEYKGTISRDMGTILVRTNDGQSRRVTLTADGVALEAAEQTPQPLGTRNDLYLPLQLLKVDSLGYSPSTGAVLGQFVLYVDADLPVNGFWVQNAQGEWVDIATAIVHEGDRIRIEFSIADGGPYDTDGAANGRISYVGGPGWLAPVGAGNERGFDLDADGRADLVMMDEYSGYVQVDLIEGLNVKESGFAAILADGWRIDGFGRFETGTAMALRHASEPEIYWGFLEGTDLIGEALVGTLKRPWEVSLLADLDGDGNSDALLHNEQTRELNVVYLDGWGQVQRTAALGVLNAKQVVRFPADLTGDGRAELVLEDTASGLVTMIRLDGDEPASFEIGTLPEGWRLVTRGFFNRDDQADLMVWDTLLGKIWLLTMEGPEIQEMSLFANVNPEFARFLHVADYDGNGLSDVLWLNEGDQSLNISLMAPLQLGTTGRLFELVPGWSVVKQ